MCSAHTHTLVVTPTPTQPEIEHCHSGFTDETTEAGKEMQSHASHDEQSLISGNLAPSSHSDPKP